MSKCCVTSGCLIEKTFTRMYREFLTDWEQWSPYLLKKGSYSMPRTDVRADQMAKQYRGLQREPLIGWMEELRGSGVAEPTDQELEASLFLTELMETGKAQDDIIFALEDARELMRKIKTPVEREIVWARRMDVDFVPDPPAGTVLLGYEPSDLYPPICFSAIATVMFFPDEKPRHDEESRFKAFHDRLNKWGLFGTLSDAEEYLKVYHSFFPDEQRYAYHLMEIREAPY